MCQVELLTLLAIMISTDPNCLEISPNDGKFLVNPTISKPFLQEFGNLVNASSVTVTDAQPLKGSALSAVDVEAIEVVETGSVIKRNGIVSPTTNDWTASYVGGDLVITFANPVGDAGGPAWVSVKGFVKGKACL